MKITLNNPLNNLRIQEPVTIGVPCPRGIVQSDSSFVLKGNGKFIPVQTTPLTLWPDKSVKWLLCDFLVGMGPGEQICLALEPGESFKKGQAIHFSTAAGDTVEVNTGVARFVLDSFILAPFKQAYVNNLNILSENGGEIWLKDQEERKFPAVIDKIDIETRGAVRLTLNVTGHFPCPKRFLFDARIHFYAGTAKTCLEFTLHNPQAAKHPGCIWDLGDPSSILFKELVVSLQMNESDTHNMHFKLAQDDKWQVGDIGKSLKIYQESSGGGNWDSPNHRNRDGLVPMKIRGYQVLQNNQIIAKGDRSQPVLWEGSGLTGLSLVVPRFWQEFPKALDVNQQTIDISLFPGCFPDLHELQGGEQKTHVLYFDFASDRDRAVWGVAPLQITIDPEAINNSGVFKDIVCGESAETQYQKFLDAALEGENSFFAKREVVDEYGWRNFGELYADHEAVFNKGDKPFVSHYNNQYDSVASFYREFFHTGDFRWAELAGDLAHHVKDIDINHTDQDREEYCHGLFWHTDHYLDAGLSTHRSVSKEHLKEKNPAFVGGGPGAQHCYTMGLMFHYLLTGNPLFREAVLRLADWSYLALRRPQTLLAALLRGVQALKTLRHMENAPAVWSRFPLTRGTGNCLNARLDAYELTGLKKYLETAAELIRGTVHPADDIDKRNLLNAEDSWCYTVFLVAVCKFLDMKYAVLEIDDDFLYARGCLLHYVNWMADNERPYLENSEMLEYPNETWVAQDLRKSVIFYHAAKYANAKSVPKFQQSCHFFVKTAFAELASRETRFFARPLVLVLQNGWVADSLKMKISQFPVVQANDKNWGSSPFKYTLQEVFRRIFSDVISCATVTSPKREWAWLKARIMK
jgi:hypothetical protein